MTNSKRLHRSSRDSVLFGVAGGMAGYFDVDPVLVRAAWVLFMLATGGAAIILYIVLAVVMPKDESSASEPSDVMRENLQSLPTEALETGRKASRRNLLAFVLIGVGIVVLLSNFGVFAWWRWDLFWPVVLIGIGATILVGRTRRRS